ncbi:MAG: hypothetical protein JW864_11655 [Spirochaetes bacterium]|nr:hypothetical protein [Spirochaetota bacterium]
MKSDIRKVSILINKNYYKKIFCELGKLEVLHLTRDDINLYSDLTTDNELQRENEVKTLFNSVKSLYTKSEIALPEVDPETMENIIIYESRDLNINRKNQYLHTVIKKIDQYEKLKGIILIRKNEIEKKITELKSLKYFFKDNGITAAMILCTEVFGTVASDINDEKLYITDKFIVKQYGNFIYGISMNKNTNEMIRYLYSFGFSNRTELLHSPGSITSEIERYINRLNIYNKRLKKINNAFTFLKTVWEKKLKEIYIQSFTLASTYDARKNFLFSKETVLISGWMNIDNINALESVLKKITSGSCYLSVSSKSESKKFINKIPVILKNLRFFKPFELLVKNAGMPENTEIDPTPFAAITYVVMFGVMFGDSGQGLIIALTGFIFRLLAGKNKVTNFFSDAGSILIYCGLSAAFFGFLYGSIFSNEHLIPALWFHPMENMMELFFAVIMMGAVFITLGILINMVNGFLSGHADESLFGTKGLMGLISYTGIIVIFFRLIQFQKQPEMWMLLVFVAVPVIVFSIRNLLAFFFLGADRIFPEGVFEYIIETIVEIIEMFSGFLGNTISFIRAGAFALSHAGLSIAVYTLADIVSPDSFSPGSITVLVIGNIFIILLEGLVCGIQSMRLEYYEFFGKFFKGNGIEFKPFSLYKQISGKGGM